MFYPLVNKEKKFVVFWNAKAGCSAVKRWYLNTIGLDYEKLNPHKFLMSHPRYGGVPEYYSNREELDGKYKDYYKFIVARNPWSRLVSYYKNKKIQVGWKNKTWPIDIRIKNLNTENITFRQLVYFVSKTPDEFLEQHIRSQTSDLHGIEFDYIVKLENFEKDMNHVCNILGISQRNFENKNKNIITGNAHQCYDMKPKEFSEDFMPSYEYFYNEQLKRLVSEKFENDINFFNYRFEEGT